MNKNKRQMLDEELKIRRWINKILVEENFQSFENSNASFNRGVMLEYSDGTPNVLAAFVDPFKDVLKVAKVATKDLLSTTKFVWDRVFAITPSAKEEARKKWKDRKKSLEGEWKDAMAPVKETLSSPTAQIAGFMLNPTGFLAAGFVKKGVKTAKATKEVLEDSGWLKGGAGEKETKQRKREEESGVVDVLGTGKKLVQDLAKMFFLAHHERSGPMLSEKDNTKDEKEQDSNNIIDGVKEYIKETPGLEDKLIKAANEVFEAKKQHVDEISKLFEEQMVLINGLSNAQDLDSFLSAINVANQKGVELGGSGLENFRKTIDDGVKKVLSNPKSREEFAKEYLTQKGEKVSKEDLKEKLSKVSDKDLKPTIEKIIFMDSKANLQKKLFVGTKELKEQIKKEILDETPPKEDWSLVSQSELGKKYIDMLNAAIKKVNDA